MFYRFTVIKIPKNVVAMTEFNSVWIKMDANGHTPGWERIVPENDEYRVRHW